MFDKYILNIIYSYAETADLFIAAKVFPDLPIVIKFRKTLADKRYYLQSIKTIVSYYHFIIDPSYVQNIYGSDDLNRKINAYRWKKHIIITPTKRYKYHQFIVENLVDKLLFYVMYPHNNRMVYNREIVKPLYPITLYD